MVTGATGRSLSVDQVVTGVGSGMNGHRRGLSRVLSDPPVSVLVVEHRDGLTGFGFGHLAAAVVAGGWQFVVLDDAETSDGLAGVT